MVLLDDMECMADVYKVLFTSQLSYPPPLVYILHYYKSHTMYHNEIGMNLAGGECLDLR